MQGKNNSKYKSLLSNTVIFAIGSFGSKIISFFLVPLYTNILSREQYGTADLVMTWANIIVPVASLVIQDSVLRFGLSKDYNRDSVIKNGLIVFFAGTLFCLLCTPVLQLYPAISSWGVYLFVISSCQILHSIMFSYTKAKELNKLYAIASIVNTLVLTITNIILLIFFHLGVEGYLIANVTANIIPSLFLVIVTGAAKDAIKAKYDRKLMKDMIRYSIPLIANNLSWWILNSSDKVMIEHYLSASELGLYTAASKIPAFLSILTSIFSQAWTVSSIKEYDTDRDRTFYSNVFRSFSLMMFLGTVGIIFVLKPFMRFYVGKSFFDSWELVPMLLLGTTFFSFGSFFGAIFGALKRNVSVTITTLVAALVNIIINFMLIPMIGVIAASISTAISYIVIGNARLFMSRKYYKFNINFLNYFINSAVVILLTVCILIGMNIYLCSFASTVLLIVINYKDLSDLLKWIKHYSVKRFHRGR